jgi:FixJ family two-component response regulator
MKKSNYWVYVVDDDASICQALERLIRSAGYRVKTFPSALDFLGHDLSGGPCCLVLDVEMPELSGLDLQRELENRQISIPIIFLTGHGTIPMSVQAMKSGAADFLTKPSNDEDLLRAIRQSLEKNRLEKNEQAEIEEVRQRIKSLTQRQDQVFRMVISGKLNKQAGHELGISEKTVKVHRARVMKKMKAGSIAALVRLAQKAGIGPT